MTVNDIIKKLSLEAVTLPEGDREVTGCYIGDLLSWVMGAAKAGDAWITIMSNINIVAVASLCDTACIILAEGVELSEEVKNAAEARGVNVLTSKQSAFAIAKELSV